MNFRGSSVDTVGLASVSEVLTIKGENIEVTPTFGAKLNTDYLLGMAKLEGGVKTLLNIDIFALRHRRKYQL